MLKIKKIILFCAILPLACFLLAIANGCKKTLDLTNYLSQLQHEVYLSDNADYKLKAFYGFCETPVQNDGVIGKTRYRINFVLYADLLSQAEYGLNFSVGERDYSLVLAPDGVKGGFTASVEINDFTLKEFTVKLSCADVNTDITMRSALPQGTIDYKTALDSVMTNQEALVKNYYDDYGNFNAEIRQRIIVKDGKPYWYVGIVDKAGGVKAMLVDGLSAEILAVREVV